MNLGFPPIRLLDAADLVIALDCEIPWMAMRKAPPADAKTVHFGLDPLHTRYPHRTFPAEQIVQGAPRLGLPMLLDALRPHEPRLAATVAHRREVVALVRQRRDAELEARREQMRALSPIEPTWLGECIADVAPKDAIFVNELGYPNDVLKLERPGCFLGNGTAGGLGYALGASLGAKLAAPDRPVIVAVGNGCYMFGNPTPFHYVSQAMNLPVLAIIQNNARWQAVDASTRVVFPAGHAAAAKTMPLVDLSPSPDFCKVGEASGAWTERVTDPAELPQALQRGLAAVARGQQALLDVITGFTGPHHG